MTQTIQPRTGDVHSNTSQTQAGTMSKGGRPQTWCVVWIGSSEDHGECWEVVSTKQEEEAEAWQEPIENT